MDMSLSKIQEMMLQYMGHKDLDTTEWLNKWPTGGIR